MNNVIQLFPEPTVLEEGEQLLRRMIYTIKTLPTGQVTVSTSGFVKTYKHEHEAAKALAVDGGELVHQLKNRQNMAHLIKLHNGKYFYL